MDKENQKPDQEPKQVDTITLPNTWSAMLMAMLTVYKDSDNVGRREIVKEFDKMALAADRYNLLAPMLRDLVGSYEKGGSDELDQPLRWAEIEKILYSIPKA